MDQEKTIYPGGFDALISEFDVRRKSFVGAARVLPHANVDLEAMKTAIVTPPWFSLNLHSKSHLKEKLLKIENEFKGQSRLLVLHSVLIAVFRSNAPPATAAPLFQRVWKEQSTFLLEHLSIRWKISAATTFADHGINMEQRTLGMGLSILLDMIKLHESERRLSGQSSRRLSAREPSGRLSSLAFGMDPYSFKAGDLDRNMLSRLWLLSEMDETLRPLAQDVLHELMSDTRTIFARIERNKAKRRTTRET